MIENGVKIVYGDIAPEAKENFVASTDDKEDFVDLSEFNTYNLYFKNYTNPVELYSTPLDGGALALPKKGGSDFIGLWSKKISNENGDFLNDDGRSGFVFISFQSAGIYSSRGLTMTFDEYNSIFPTDVYIEWYANGSVLTQKTFHPKSAVYFFENEVDGYDRIDIYFRKLNMPFNRLKFRSIDYGSGTQIYGNELRRVKLIQQIDPISSEIAINTVDFEIDSKGSNEYYFQAKQPISTYFNGELLSTTFVKTAKKKTEHLWSIQSEDYIGIMDVVPFYGGVYKDKPCYELFEEIFSTAKVPYDVSSVSNSNVSGYIPYTTCREALMQLCFAMQVAADTSNSGVVRVFELSEEISQEIPSTRIMQGQSFSDDDKVTSVEVTSHTYKPSEESVEAYDAEESGIGENIFVKFSEPLHDLTITNGGSIISSGQNYAIISAVAGSVLVGKKYEHTMVTHRKNNPFAFASGKERVLAIERATLVSSQNIDNVLEKCYNWLTRVNSTNMKIVEGKHKTDGERIKYGTALYGSVKYGGRFDPIVTYDKRVNVGEKISFPKYKNSKSDGTIIKQSFNLNGGIIIKEAVVK